jgi:yeast amino acid transporter
VVILFYIVGYAWKRTGFLRLHQIDVDSGRRELNQEALEKIMAQRAQWPAWRKVLNIFF